MSKINILDESVFNKISAGEVVERPSSVVKELLDNSIDAGATNILINITDGGIKNITITDNGSGIEPDDFGKVFISHATSKIKTAEDLEKIGTLGFRGEALASIASVAKVKLTSKIKGQTFARFCTVEGGKQSETTEVGGDNGTTLSVSDLFFNVPARAKFLKKPKAEMMEITNLIARYILCHPNISFKYIADEKLIYQSTGTNLLDAIYIVYGKQATSQVIKVDLYNKYSGISVSGYIGLPTFSKPNRTYQTLSINNRYVVSQLVSTCVYNAYEHYLMKGQFPFFVLDLNIPLDKLDVNVHPTKMEVRFNNSNEIYGTVYNAISSALYNCDKITTLNSVVTNYDEVKSGSSFLHSSAENTNQNSAMQPKTIQIEPQKTNASCVDLNLQNLPKNNKDSLASNATNQMQDDLFLQALLDKGKSQNSNVQLHQPASPIMSKLITNRFEQSMLDETPTQNDNLGAEPTKTKTEEFFDTSDIKFVGQIFALFLIVEKQDKVYIIDEHAGHERLLFDRFVKEVDARQVQKQHLLAPYTINVNMQEFAFLEDNLDKLTSLGFDIEPFGSNTFIISSIPALLADININQFFDEILKDLSNMKALKQSDLILTKLMQHSCKCAVRAGKMLSAGEVNSLIEQMKAEKMQLQCPHGRPVVVELTKMEVEKWFKRIV